MRCSCNVNTLLFVLCTQYRECIPGKTSHVILITIVMGIQVYVPQKGFFFPPHLFYCGFPRYEHTYPNFLSLEKEKKSIKGHLKFELPF